MLERSGRGVFGSGPLGHPEVGYPGGLLGELGLERLAVEQGLLRQRAVVRVQRFGRLQLLVVDLRGDS